MNPRSRQRFLRNFVGSLMQSDLTISEMQEILFELENRTFNQEMARVLRETMLALRGVKAHGSESFSTAEISEKIILAAIQRRKMSKRTLGSLIEKISPKTNVSSLMGLGTTRGMIQKFFDTASSIEVKRLADLLANNDNQDAYLRGIVRRD